MAQTRMTTEEFKRLTQGAATPAPAQPQALFAKHEAHDLTITLPLPPSANHHWRMVLIGKSPRMLLSSEGRKYRVAVAAIVAREWPLWSPLTGPLRVTVTIAYRDKRRIDLDNRLKPLLDALTEAKVWGDDSQVDDLRVVRGPVCPPDGHAIVWIESF